MSEELNIEEELQKLDAAEETANYYIQRAKDYEVLINIPQFQSVILDGYLRQEEQDVFEMLTSVFTNKAEVQEKLNYRLEMIRNMKAYLGTDDYAGTIMLEGQKYKEELKAIATAREALISEEFDNGSK